MNKLLVLIAGCVLSTLAFATGETGQGASYIDQTHVIDRFRELERMDVTSERELVDSSELEPLSHDLDAILAESEALESAD